MSAPKIADNAGKLSLVTGLALALSLAANAWLLSELASRGRGHLSTAEAGFTAIAERRAKSGTTPDLSSSEPSRAVPGKQDLQQLLADPSKHERLLEEFKKWVGIDPAQALAWAENSSEGRIRLDLLQAGLGTWGQLDPAAAAGWISGMPNDFTYEAACLQVVGKWAARDAVAAAEWVAKLPEVGLRKSAAEVLVANWARQDPAAAASWGLAFQGNNMDCPAFARALEVWAKSDPVKAREHWALHATNEIAAAAVSYLAGAAAETDAPGTVRWAGSLSDEGVRWDALNAAFDSWSQNRPSEASDFILTLPEAQGREHHLATLIRHWSASDNARAEQWTSSLPRGKDFDTCATALAESLSVSSPSKALDWACQVSEGAGRTEIVCDAFREWLGENRPAAEAWLKEAADRQDPNLMAQLQILANGLD